MFTIVILTDGKQAVQGTEVSLHSKSYSMHRLIGIFIWSYSEDLFTDSKNEVQKGDSLFLCVQVI